MLDLLQDQSEILGISVETIRRKIGGLRIPQRRAATEGPIPEELDLTESLPNPIHIRILLRILSLGEDRLVGQEALAS